MPAKADTSDRRIQETLLPTMPAFTQFDNYTPAADALADTVVLVTGAGDGLGRSLAVKSASLGATVILLGRTEAKLEAVYDEIETHNYPQAAIFPLDLATASMQCYPQLAESIASEFGKLNALVHCAASLGPMTPLANYPASEWQKILQTNLTAPVFLTQACLGLLTQDNPTSILFTIDSKSRAYWGAYGVSKAAIESTMRIFADELDNKRDAQGGRLVSVNAIEPGAMRTHIRRSAYPGEILQSNHSPEIYLDSYLYLLDPSTEKPNGQVIRAMGNNKS